MTERISKWAISEPVSSNDYNINKGTPLNSIDVSDEALLERAACDFVVEFVGHIVAGKTTTQAIAALDCWRGWLETVRECSK